MSAVEIDSVIVDLEARIGQYRTNITEATKLYQGLRAEVERPFNDNGQTAAAARAKASAREVVQAEEQATQQVASTRKTRTAAAKQADAEEAASAKAAAKAKADAAKLAAKEEAAAAKEAAAAVKAAEREKQAAIAASERAMAQAAAAEARFQAQQTRRAEARFYASGPQMFEARARELRALEAAAIAAAAPVPVRRPLDISSGVVTPASGPIVTPSPVPASVANWRPEAMAPAAAVTEKEAAAAAAAKERALIEAEINDRAIAQLGLKAQIIAADKADAVVLQDQLFALQQFGRYRALGLDEAAAQAKVDAELLAIEQKRVAAAAEQAALVEKQMRAKSGAIAGKISGAGLLTGALVGGLGAAEISHLNDRYIELSNSLKVAGVSASEFDAVQQHLLTTANKNGTNINALADVFRSASLGAHDLGASQADLLKLTDAASNAMRIQGVSASRAQGSLLQLGHAFESGRVNAREFNSLALNLYPILQAAAKGSDQFGGSVAKLRQEIIAGNVSSKIFFDAIIAGSGDLEERAGKATLTTAQGFTSLTNALVVYFGEADKAQGVSAALGSALKTLGDNLNVLIPAIAAIGTALTVGYITRMAAAAVATEGLGASILGAFGGPVGLAISAVVLALGAYAIETNSAAAASKAHGDQSEVTAKAISKLNNILSQDPAKGVTKNAQDLAKARLDQANATYQAAAAEIALRKSQATARLKDLEDGTVTDMVSHGRGGVRAEQTTYTNRALAIERGKARNAVEAADQDQAALDKALADAKKNVAAASLAAGSQSSNLSPKDARDLANWQRKLAGFQKAAANASGSRLDRLNDQIADAKQRISNLQAGYGANAGLGGRRGPSADTLAKRAESARQKGIREEEAYTSEKKQVRDKELQSLVDLSNDAEKRADLERQRLRDAAADQDHNDRLKGPKDPKLNDGVAGTGERTAAQTQALIDARARTTSNNIAVIDRDERLRKANDARSIDDANLEIQKAALQAQESIADTLKERRRIAQQILDIEFQQKQNALDAILSKDSKATDAEKTIAQAQRDALPAQKKAAQGDLDRQNQGVGRAYADSFGKDPQQILEGTEVKVLQDFNGELDKTVSKALNLHGIFGEIVDDLVQMAIKQALIAPIANTIFPANGSTSSGGAGGFFSSLISNIGSAFGGGASKPSSAFTAAFSGDFLDGARANGGPVDAGGTYLVGERGPELLRMGSQGGNIVPNHALASMNQNTRASVPQVAGPTINQTIRYSGAVDIADKSYVQQMGAALYAHTEQAVTQGSQQTLAATPAYMQRNTQLK